MNENSVSDQIDLINTAPNQKKHTKSYFSIILLLIFGFGALFFINIKGLQDKSVEQDALLKEGKFLETQIVPTPIPFIELTVPYLREKKYDSKLGELNSAYVGSNYNAYITNYTSDGLTVNGLLTRPIGETPEGGFKAIIFIHGYLPPESYQTSGVAYSDYVDYLARSGFVVFKIDLRGHGNSEGEPGGGYYGSDYVSDILHAFSALQNSDFVNPTSIGLWGQAVKRNNEILQQNPNDIYSRFNLSVAYYHLKDYEKSVKEFEMVESQLPFRTLWYQIEPILSYYELKNYNRVFSITDKILGNYNRAFSELYVIRGKIYQNQGDPENARSEYEKAVFYNNNLKEAQELLNSL